MSMKACTILHSVALVLGLAAGVSAAPTAEQALRLTPIQKDVDYDRPASASKCTIKAEKTAGKTGWVVRDASDQILRVFLDSNSDNVVDQWCYFKDGLEVYRDIDANFNGKADQYRWLNTSGTRWGTDRNEDGAVDAWKSISAEEVTAEVVAALRDSDADRFRILLLTPQELEELGFSDTRLDDLKKKIAAATDEFKAVVRKQKTVTPDTKWSSFGGNRPGLVPAGTDDLTTDLVIYENAAAMIEAGTKHNQVPIGTLIRVGDTWRLIDAPQLSGDNSGDLVAQSYFFDAPLAGKQDTGESGKGGPSAKAQTLMAELGKIDQAAAGTPTEQAKLNDRRADILEELATEATEPQERAGWLRQFADTVSTSVQAGGYPEGVERLRKQYESLKGKAGDADLAAYVEFRYMTAQYGQNLQKPDADYPKIQAEWMEDLEKYIAAHPKSADIADAMYQLATARELAGEEDKALKWYETIARDHRNSMHVVKAQGAQRRLQSVGRPISLKGRSLGGNPIDLAATPYKGKVVLIQYWATWSEPCLEAIPQIKEMLAKYGQSGFTVIGVSFDSRPKILVDYLKENNVPWPQIYEAGGMENRLANELGILTVPTMILVDKQGRVVNRNVHARELDAELKGLLKPRVASKQVLQ